MHFNYYNLANYVINYSLLLFIHSIYPFVFLRYLNCNGKLEVKCSDDCLFSAEYHSGHLALRDRHGSYLSPIGSKAVLKSRSQTVTRDELFSLEDSLPQASFIAALNNKYVSVKQGVDVTANQDEIGDNETFQLEFDWSAHRWALRTTQV